MKDWLNEFQNICEEMERSGEKEINLPLRGKIVVRDDLECPNCGEKGIFYGEELEGNWFYECNSASYCSNCRKVFNVVEKVNFSPYNQERFLPIMKKKLIEYLKSKKRPKIQEMISDLGLEFGSLIRKKKSCPVCGGDTYTFYKDLGGVDYYDNYCTVCVNPSCYWEGVHIERHEPGLYIRR